MRIAIVGAGVSGISSALWLVRQFPQAIIDIYEKSKGVGGRAATRRVQDKLSVDTGCQFISFDDDQLEEFFLEVAPDGSVREIPLPILCTPDGWIVDPEGRYYIDGGMTKWSKSALSLLLKEGAGRVSVHFDTTIEPSTMDTDPKLKSADMIVVTAPGPQAREFGSKKAVDYNSCLAVIFHWHQMPNEAREHYAFRDISNRSGITWVAHEGLKCGTPGLWIAQVSPDRSEAWNGLSSEEGLEDMITEDLSAWISSFTQGHLTFLDKKFWRYAFPAHMDGAPDPLQVPLEELRLASGRSCYFIGDGYHGVGRFESALVSARGLTSRLVEQLK